MKGQDHDCGEMERTLMKAVVIFCERIMSVKYSYTSPSEAKLNELIKSYFFEFILSYYLGC
jgi:hypothetical protein